jgi:hypothetical protein
MALLQNAGKVAVRLTAGRAEHAAPTTRASEPSQAPYVLRGTSSLVKSMQPDEYLSNSAFTRSVFFTPPTFATEEKALIHALAFRWAIETKGMTGCGALAWTAPHLHSLPLPPS